MRCFKGRFPDATSAKLGMKRCHGSDVLHNGVKWKPCQYLEKCLGMPVEEWREKAQKQGRI
jgi:hypothetical protein